MTRFEFLTGCLFRASAQLVLTLVQAFAMTFIGYWPE
jgi:hypothetical protein